MKWQKGGLVFSPRGDEPWSRHTALQPTPILSKNGTFVRVYFGTRDDEGVSRVSFVDLDSADPRRVIGYAKQPALDIGLPGTFDDNGVVPCALVRRDDRIWMYYAGYQIPHRIKFMAFGGLAVSDDEGVTFHRVSQVPVLDRTDRELYFRAAHTVLWEGDLCRVWYGGGSSWRESDGKQLPVYDVRYLESPVGHSFPDEGETHVTFETESEFRIGRPIVYRAAGIYRMFYGFATTDSGYRLGYAESSDGYIWTRRDGEMELTVSETGWDSEMIAYPSIVELSTRTFMFYNGNQMGKDGFGVAELIHW